jgi:hypothetical protein
MSDVILTSECEYCQYGTVDDSDKARVKVYCSHKEKWLWYGCYVPCDNFTKDRRDEE